MTDAVGRRDIPSASTDATAPEIPDRYLPGVPYREMPEPLPLRKVLGPGVILLAAAIGSGEYVIWPYITYRAGLAMLWLALIGVLTQFFVNMEIERYTLATGETAVTGFTRLWKPWGPLFIVMTVIPWAWPGWATGASTTLTYAFGLRAELTVPITIGLLIAIGIALTASPVIYQTTEKAQSIMVALIVAFLIVAAIRAIHAGAWSELATGLTNPQAIPAGIREIAPAMLLGALAFAGAGGSLNLVISNWIRDKGMGMGAHAPRLVSPLSGEEEAAPSTGFFFRQTEDNLRRWKGWWRVANLEQFVTFYLMGAVTIVLLATLTYATIGNDPAGEQFEFIRYEGEVLQGIGGDWLGTAFCLTGAVVLFSTNLGVLDMVGRVTADVLKVGPLRDSTRWTEGKIYITVVWAEIAFGSAILLSGVTQPLLLLVIAASLNGLVMFIYSALLIKLNAGVLPRTIRLRGARLAVMVWAVLFFGGFSLFTLWDQGRQVLGGR